jgi:hypothetical protein
MPPIRPLGALLVALAAVSGCGGDDGGGAAARTPTTTAVQPVDLDPELDRAGSVAQLADCAFWKKASRDQRYATIADIRGQHTPQQSTTAESPLSDDRAYEVFERACAANPAGALRLYKLYVKVQGFAPLSE